MPEGLKIGLALGGGGARGAAHIGVLSELETASIPIHLIAGTSAGSLIGALYSAGLSPDQILALAQRSTWRDLVHLTLPRVGLVNASRMEILLNDILNHANLEDLPIPLATVACNLYTGEEVVLSQGNAALSVIASCSIPGIFVPMAIGEKLLVDGGLVNGVPVSVARQMGADVTIAVKLHQGVHKAHDLDNIFAILAQSFEVIQCSQRMDPADVLIAPELGQHHIGDLTKTMSAFLAGKAAARAAVPEILKVMAMKRESRLPS